MQVSEEIPKKRFSGGRHQIKQIKQARLDFGGICAWNGCKTTTGLQFAHRYGFEVNTKSGRGSNVRLRYIIKTPAFLLLLCDVHHIEYDQKSSEDGSDDSDDEEDF